MLEALSSERVLTMEYMTGVGVTDIDASKREGLHPAEARRCTLSMQYPNPIPRPKANHYPYTNSNPSLALILKLTFTRCWPHARRCPFTAYNLLQ